VNFKSCPNCNAEVPAVANLCKHCFHDFHTVVAKRKSPLWPVLFFALGSALVSAAAYAHIHSVNRTSKVSIDGETERIVFTTVYASGPESTQVFFKDVATVEYVMDASPRPFEVAVVTSSGERHVMSQADDSLDFKARQLSEMLGKPLVTKGGVELPAKK
jgi:hypothetical protein